MRLFRKPFLPVIFLTVLALFRTVTAAGQDLLSVLADHQPERVEETAARRRSGTVHGNDVNVRESPWGPIIGTANWGDNFFVLGQEGDWFKVEVNGRIAFIHSSFFVAEPESGESQTIPVSGTVHDGTRMTQAEFIGTIAEICRNTPEQQGVPISVTIAQTIVECYYGRTPLAKYANNLFAIKGTGPAGSYEGYRKYNDWEESIRDHALLLRTKSWYQKAMSVASDPDQFAREIHKAGYATDPAYSAKLIETMRKFDLYRFDKAPGA